MEKNSAILITGGTGLLGSYLIKHLHNQGFTNIKATKRAQSNMQQVNDLPPIIWLEGDVLDAYFLEDAMQDIEYVFHCAAMVSYNQKDATEMLKINVEGTANVVDACLNADVKKLVHVSSIAALGRAKKDAISQLVSEKSKFQDKKTYSNYALSKYLGEQEVWRGSAEGLNVAIVSPSIILGSGHWNQSSSALFNTVWHGLKYYPIGSTGFVDVQDVVLFMSLLMQSDISDERYILSAENMSLKDFFTKIALSIGKNPPSIEIKPWLNGLIWRLEWLRCKFGNRKPMVTKETAQTSAEIVAFDNQKSTQVFDFQYVSIHESIVKIGKDFREKS